MPRSKKQLDAEVETFLQAHGTSKKGMFDALIRNRHGCCEELSAFFIDKGVYRSETKNGKTEKGGRIQFSIRGDKFKLYNAK